MSIHSRVAVAFALGAIFVFASATPSQACYICAEPEITSQEPETIPPSPGKVVRLQIKGSNIETVGSHPDWRLYIHIWVRKISASGEVGGWAHCEGRVSGCNIKGSDDAHMKLEIDGSTWAAEDGSQFQMHYFLGLADVDIEKPEFGGTSQRMSHWSKIVTWRVTSTLPGIRLVTPPAPPKPARGVETPGGNRDVAPAPAGPADAADSSDPEACAKGYVWREARADDHVCVTPEARTRTRAENAAASSHTVANSGAGPANCQPGYVWREAFPGDYACVEPSARDIARQENAMGPSRLAK